MRRAKPKSLLIPLFFYWLALFIWQNIAVVESRSAADVAVKAGLMIFLMAACVRTAGTQISIGLNVLRAAAIYVVCILFTCINSISTLGLSDVISYAFTLIFIVFFFGVDGKYKAGKDEMNRLLTLVILFNLYLVIYCLFFKTEHYTQLLTITNAYGNELSAFMSSNHEFAMYLFFGIMACIWKLVINKNRPIMKVIYCVLAVVFFGHIVLSFSRTAMLACAIAIFVFAFIYNKRLFAGLCVLAVAITVLVASNKTVYHIVYDIILKENTSAGRDNLYEIAIKIFGENNVLEKLFGVGVTKTVQLVTVYAEHKSFHSAYLTVLISAGLAMFFLLVFGTFLPLKDSMKAYKRTRFDGAWLLSLALAGVSFMLTNTAIYFYSPIDSFMLTLFCVLLPKYRKNALYAAQEGTCE